ncbi:LacI family DNA-binding transcriptional regulator [Paenibacillus athensensis]|uniref:LacI family transcriptional regulator n=1 Tax=Paenibacillus athensensis TaxID=1967502 RepID=A0A4Y8Q975_9BACL|nr:LacI family DNA-binding transcriptional regulator [Paenibacillus athensensis]MCD1258958.1 LacI family DNA-binding transcriptional regulator [Paenibacillus athensensis]
MAKKVTMQHIADHLGVSKYVISKALSAQDGVSPATRERVLHAAKQLGYFTQKQAHMQKARPAGEDSPEADNRPKQSVLVLMPSIRFQTRESGYWGKVLDGVSLALEQSGLGMVIVTETNADRFMNVLNPQGFLGLIGIGLISASFLLEIHRIGLPMVLVDHEEPLIPCDTVFINNIDSVGRLTDYLIGLGHRHLQFVGNIHYSRSFFDRWNGFRNVMEENGLHGPVVPEPLGMSNDVPVQSREELRLWLDHARRTDALPTALVCANDAIAINAMDALRELGLSVPDDISVTGFDNIDDAVVSQPPLTTIHVAKELLGKRAVEMLQWRLAHADEPFEKRLLAGTLLARGSHAAARQREAAL